VPGQVRGDQTKGRSEDTLTDPHYDRDAYNPDTIHHFISRQGFIVLGGHDGYFMTATGKGTRQSFGVYGETGCMGAIVSKNSKDFHSIVFKY
jgi:hypothetical protein